MIRPVSTYLTEARQLCSLKLVTEKLYNWHIMKTFKESLGLKIKEYRKSRGYTQEKLAEIIELNQRQLTRIESGENYPSAETIEKICIALDIEPKWIYDFEWQIKESLAKTGTDAKPVLRLVKKDEVITVKSSSPEIIKEFKTKRQFPANQSEKSIIECARKMNQAIKVEYFDGRERSNIKVFHPDGIIETLLTNEQVLTFKTFEKLNEKVKSISKDRNKMNFVIKAIESLEDKEALKELQYLIKGIELTL